MEVGHEVRFASLEGTVIVIRAGRSLVVDKDGSWLIAIPAGILDTIASS